MRNSYMYSNTRTAKLKQLSFDSRWISHNEQAHLNCGTLFGLQTVKIILTKMWLVWQLAVRLTSHISNHVILQSVIVYLIESCSDFVRLGEYDISTTKDGKHIDSDIVGAKKHEQYIKNTGINDIAILYLKKDVKFNGE